MRTPEEIREEIQKVEKAGKAAEQKQKRVKERLAELEAELKEAERR